MAVPLDAQELGLKRLKLWASVGNALIVLALDAFERGGFAPSSRSLLQTACCGPMRLLPLAQFSEALHLTRRSPSVGSSFPTDRG